MRASLRGFPEPIAPEFCTGICSIRQPIAMAALQDLKKLGDEERAWKKKKKPKEKEYIM